MQNLDAFFVYFHPSINRLNMTVGINFIFIYLFFSIIVYILIEKLHRKRNPKDLEPYLTLAEDYHANPDSYNQAEKKRRGLEIKKIGKSYSRVPLYNAFHDAPMGHDLNYIENSPVDMLHTIWGGLMKNMCGYILSICHQIGKYSGEVRFSKLLETLEERISSFPKVYEKAPHVQWTYFPNGLVSKLLEGLTSSEAGGNTGKGGEFRSAHLSLLYFKYILLLNRYYHFIQ